MKNMKKDDFLSKEVCDRCGNKLTVARILSDFNTDCLCLDCKDKEKLNPAYEIAKAIEVNQGKNGNFNFEGIGYPKKIFLAVVLEDLTKDLRNAIAFESKTDAVDYIAYKYINSTYTEEEKSDVSLDSIKEEIYEKGFIGEFGYIYELNYIKELEVNLL